jgi:hypothetical protein
MKTGQENDERAGSVVPGPAGARRRTLLAKVHIATKELGLPPADYRALLMGRFGVPSAGDLSTRDMERLLDHFVGCGWRPERRRERRASLAAMRKRQIFALQARARQIFSQLEDRDERRLQGLCEKICGTNDLASCRDAAKLRRILAVLAGIKKRESRPPSTLH